MATGIVKRHRKDCPAPDGGRCRCEPGWEAWVVLRREGKKVTKTFAREAEARSWRADALVAAERGALRAPSPTTVREAWTAWYEGAKAGTIRNRSGDAYKPGSLRGYERAMRLRVLPDFGATRLGDLQRPDLQEFVRRLLAEGLNPSTVQVTLLPLRAVYRHALERGQLRHQFLRWAPAAARRGTPGAGR